jgi:hypothetical protein
VGEKILGKGKEIWGMKGDSLPSMPCCLAYRYKWPLLPYLKEKNTIANFFSINAKNALHNANKNSNFEADDKKISFLGN